MTFGFTKDTPGVGAAGGAGAGDSLIGVTTTFQS